MKVYSQLERAQIEQLAADPTGGDLVLGRIWLNTTDNVYRRYDGTKVVDVEVSFLSADPVSPYEGQVWYNSTEKTVKFYDGTSKLEIGAGGGGLDTFYTEDFVAVTAVAASGQNASFDGGGTASGGYTQDTSTPMSGPASGRITAGPTSTNDYFKIDTIDLDLKQRDIHIGLRMLVDMSNYSVDAEFVIYDETNNALLTESASDILTGGTARTFFSTSVRVPATCTQISYGFHLKNITGAPVNAEYINFDDVEFSTNPFVYKDITERYSYYIQSPTVTDYTDEIRLTNPVSEATIEGNTLFAVADDSGNARTTWTALKDCYVHVSCAGRPSIANRRIDIYLNGSGKITGSATDTNARVQNTAGAFKVVAGDIISFAFPSTAGNSVSYFSIVAYADTEHVVTPAKVVNESYYIATTNNFWDTSGGDSDTWDFSLATPSFSTSELISVADGGGDTRITAIEDVILTGSVKAYLGSLGAAVQVFDHNNNMIMEHSGASGDRIPTPFSIKVEAGNYIWFRCTNPNANRQGNLSLHVQKAEAQFLAAVPMNYTQTKVLSSSSTATGVISDLTFNNLVVGKVYSIDAVFSFTKTTGLSNSTDATIAVSNGATSLGQIRRNFNPIQDTVANHSFSRTFVATDTTVTFNATTMTRIQYNATVTHATLTELNYTKETTRFS